MQIMYVLTFLVSLFVMMSTGTRDSIETTDSVSEAVGQHMALWHNTALEMCAQTTCTGIVDPRATLKEPVKSGKAFAANRFTSRYDGTPTQEKVVTFLTTSFAKDPSTDMGTIVSTMTSNLGGESSSVGTWNKARNVVMFGHAPHGDGLDSRQEMALPASIGIVIPDGSPVLVNRP